MWYNIQQYLRGWSAHKPKEANMKTSLHPMSQDDSEYFFRLRSRANHFYFEGLREFARNNSDNSTPSATQRKMIFRHAVRDAVTENNPRVAGSELERACDDLQAFIARHKTTKSVPPQDRTDYQPKIAVLADQAEDVWAVWRDSRPRPTCRRQSWARFEEVVNLVLDRQAKLPAPRRIVKRSLKNELRRRSRARAEEAKRRAAVAATLPF